VSSQKLTVDMMVMRQAQLAGRVVRTSDFEMKYRSLLPTYIGITRTPIDDRSTIDPYL
jgi:hypothetical protein